MAQRIDIVVGLGNPGSEYEQTRHNAGFWFADAIADAYGERFKADKKLRSLTADVSIDGQRIRLLKPQTFMNLSGEAVQAALSYYKLAPENMLVAYDEIDFPPGKLRLKLNGGHAGHNGIRNIIAHVGANFWRLRLGVGHPGERSKVVGHVLKRANATDRDLIQSTISAGIEALPAMVRDGCERAQLLLHTET